MITQIHHKKDEFFAVNFFEDAECTIPFDFKGKKHLYIETKDGDITPLIALDQQTLTPIIIYVPYTTYCFYANDLRIKTLNDITPNLSKYIPEDNAVLFLSEEHIPYSDTQFSINFQMHYPNFEIFKNSNDKPNKLTIFLPHGTQSELQKANEVAKELKEKYGVEEVNVFVLHCFISLYGGVNYINAFVSRGGDFPEFYSFGDFFNKIITTNSTGILRPEDSSERLQVIDCKEFFEEYLKENNL